MAADGTFGAARAEGPGLGLVPISTSDTQGGYDIACQTAHLRFGRLRKAVRCSAALFMEARREDRKLHGFRFYPVLVTLTYRNVGQGDPRDISRYLKNCREYLRRRGHQFRFVWVAELQGRGAVHYHVLCWLPQGGILPKPDESGWWPHGTSNIQRARKPVGYLTKYVSKIKSKLGEGVEFPKRLRTHGAGGLDETRRERRAIALRPGWLREVASHADKPRPAPGGGFVSKVTGEHWASPYRVLSCYLVPGIGRVILLRREVGALT